MLKGKISIKYIFYLWESQIGGGGVPEFGKKSQICTVFFNYGTPYVGFMINFG